METLLKFFPFLPKGKDDKALIISLVFYLLVPPIAGTLVAIVLGMTIILAPLAAIVGLAASAYTIMGVVFAILSYCGIDIVASFNKKDGEKKDEEKKD